MRPDVKKNLDRIVGRTVVESKIGVGSFVTFLFNNIENEHSDLDWYLWVQHVGWRFESVTEILLTSEYLDRSSAKIFVNNLIGTRITKILCSSLSHDFDMHFDNGLIFRIFAYEDNHSDYTSWELFTSENEVIEVGPGRLVKIVPRDG
ncbi:MAG: hypothetical protein EOP04_10305 [Proteobacteria bacterium]|nr:MAG: hypothetical protein EOP04_10305 [Pseudomonadota bacterium]